MPAAAVAREIDITATHRGKSGPGPAVKGVLQAQHHIEQPRQRHLESPNVSRNILSAWQLLPPLRSGRQPHNRASLCSSSDAGVVLDELGEGRDSALLGLVEVALDNLAVLVDEGDGREALGLERCLHKLAVLVAAVLDHVDLALRRKLLHLLLHALAELAPRRVRHHQRVLAALGQLLRLRLRQVLHLALAVLPEVAVPGLLCTGDVDAALRLGRPVLVLQTHKPPLPLRGVVEPLRLVALKLVVDKLDRTVRRHLDGVLGVADGGVSLGVEGVDRDLVLGDVVEAVLKRPVR
mmetsp:Transcript_3057/g.5717  ORF Transcript_3057/g.5717 Transcript_3057/m.5717 type:complete len:294 (-) Transcript_3057:712-1593(-)